MLFVGFLFVGVVWLIVSALIGRELVLSGDVTSARIIGSLSMCGFMFPAGVWIVVRCDAPPGYHRAQQDLMGGALCGFLLGVALFGGGVALVAYSQPLNPWGSTLELPGVFFLCAGAWLAKVAWRNRGTSTSGDRSALPPPPHGLL